MTASGIVPSESAAIRIRSVSPQDLFYAISLALITVGFYAYWGLWRLKFFDASWAICLLLAGIFSLFGRLRLVAAVRSSVFVAVWIGYLALSALWAPDPRTTLIYVASDLLTIVAFVLGFVWAASTPRKFLALFFELQLLQVVPLMIWYAATTGGLTDDTHGAARSEFASRILMAIPFVVWRLRADPGIFRGLLLLSALIATVALQSRALLIIAPIILVASWVFVQRPGRRGPAMLQVLTLCLAAGILAIGIPSVQESLQRSLERFGPQGTSLEFGSTVQELAGPAQDRTDIERRVQLVVAAQSFLAHPILGAGFFSTYTITTGLLAAPVSAHGLPSTLLGEAGLVGTCIFAIMIVVFFRRVGRARRRAEREDELAFLRILIVAMVGALLLGLFQQVDQAYWFYVLLAWGYSADRISIIRRRDV